MACKIQVWRVSLTGRAFRTVSSSRMMLAGIRRRTGFTFGRAPVGFPRVLVDFGFVGCVPGFVGGVPIGFGGCVPGGFVGGVPGGFVGGVPGGFGGGVPIGLVGCLSSGSVPLEESGLLSPIL